VTGFPHGVATPALSPFFHPPRRQDSRAYCRGKTGWVAYHRDYRCAVVRVYGEHDAWNGVWYNAKPPSVPLFSLASLARNPAAHGYPSVSRLAGRQWDRPNPEPERSAVQIGTLFTRPTASSARNQAGPAATGLYDVLLWRPPFLVRPGPGSPSWKAVGEVQKTLLTSTAATLTAIRPPGRRPRMFS